LGAHLQGVRLSGADFEGADFEGADLRGADLAGAHLGKADFRGTNLGEAHLGKADFEGADLEGTDFEGANLEGIDLSKVKSFYNAKLDSSILSELKVKWPEKLATTWNDTKQNWVIDTTLLETIKKPDWHGWPGEKDHGK
jgi:uncharacterized protein YjbI with pentapeptide repeats